MAARGLGTAIGRHRAAIDRGKRADGHRSEATNRGVSRVLRRATIGRGGSRGRRDAAASIGVPTAASIKAVVATAVSSAAPIGDSTVRDPQAPEVPPGAGRVPPFVPDRVTLAGLPRAGLAAMGRAATSTVIARLPTGGRRLVPIHQPIGPGRGTSD